MFGQVVVPAAWLLLATADISVSGNLLGAYIAYEATLDSWQGQTQTRGWLVVEGTRFRLGKRYNFKTNPGPPSYHELYDGGRPPIVWEYRLEDRVAGPTRESIQSAILREAALIGRIAFRRKYGIPASVPDRALFAPAQTPRPSIRLLRKSDLPDIRWMRRGKERVAGHLCEVRQGNNPPPASTARGAESNEWRRSARAWLEPKTGLVLRFEERLEPPPTSAVPPMRSGYVVTMFRRLKAVDRSKFRLPAGSRAALPETMRNVRLPDGVSRERMKGRQPSIGIEFPVYERAKVR